MSTEFQRLIYDVVAEVDTVDLEDAAKVELLKDAMLDMFDIFAMFAMRESLSQGLYDQGHYDGQEHLARQVLETIKGTMTKGKGAGMTDKISEARQALRDYARTEHTVSMKEIIGAAWIADPPDIPDGLMISTSRGEAGGKAFMAVQAALTVAEELRAESRQQPVIWNDDADLRAKAAAADRIEAAVLKALA